MVWLRVGVGPSGGRGSRVVGVGPGGGAGCGWGSRVR